MAKTWDLTAIGDANADLILSNPTRMPDLGQEVLADDSLLALGGSTALMAAAAARLGLKVRMVGKVGGDGIGTFVMEALRQAGVDVSLMVVERHSSTGITVALSWPRDRALVTSLGTIGSFRPDEVPPAAIEDTRHVHMASFYLQAALRSGFRPILRRARSAGATTSIDTGDDPEDLWGEGIRDVLSATDFFFPNLREATRITGRVSPVDAIRDLAKLTTSTVMKLGAEGAMALVGDQLLRIGAFPIEAVDTTGAGDAFNAGYVWGYLQGARPEDCLRRASAVGALATTWLGGDSLGLNPGRVLRLLEETIESVTASPVRDVVIE